MSESETVAATAVSDENDTKENNDTGATETKVDETNAKGAATTEDTNGSEKETKEENKPKPEDAKNLYEFTVKDIDGNEVSLDKYKGHPTLVVNVASNCGLTKNNYNQLNQLYEKYEKDGLRIAAFPCNQFLNQESACDVDIKEFAKKNNVKFDMYAKVNVNGAETIPLYRWLKVKQRGLFGTQAIKWNFTKFLIDREGNPIKRYSPTTSPSAIEPDLKPLLNTTE